MKALDVFLQRWRIRQALQKIAGQARVIDVGAHQGELFERLGGRLQAGFGIEPLLPAPRIERGAYVLQKGYFPEVGPEEKGAWNYVTLLAVLEHVPRDAQVSLAEACHMFLGAGGRVIITVPGPFVDCILAVLRFFRLIDGMSLEEHYGFNPADVKEVFREPHFRLLHHSRFQLGLNNLFVFEKM